MAKQVKKNHVKVRLILVMWFSKLVSLVVVLEPYAIYLRVLYVSVPHVSNHTRQTIKVTHEK